MLRALATTRVWRFSKSARRRRLWVSPIVRRDELAWNVVCSSSTFATASIWSVHVARSSVSFAWKRRQTESFLVAPSTQNVKYLLFKHKSLVVINGFAGCCNTSFWAVLSCCSDCGTLDAGSWRTGDYSHSPAQILAKSHCTTAQIQ